MRNRAQLALLQAAYASFLRHMREVNGDRVGLVIFTAGFPARSHLRQIVRLATVAQETVNRRGIRPPFEGGWPRRAVIS